MDVQVTRCPQLDHLRGPQWKVLEYSAYHALCEIAAMERRKKRNWRMVAIVMAVIDLTLVYWVR